MRRVKSNWTCRAAGRRTGSIYLITLGTALLVSLLAMAALLKLQIRRAQSADAAAMLEARTYARAAVSLAHHRARTDPNWRSKMALGTWDVEQAIGNGSLRFRASDPDGSLTDSDYDPVRITATGFSGPARQVIQVSLVPQRIGYSCLGVCLHSGGALEFRDVQFNGRQTVSANGDVWAADSLIAANVEAVGQISGNTYAASTTAGIAARSLPGSDVFYDYLAAATLINYNALPDASDNFKRIYHELLSPTQNPWGGGNPAGIYTIDCGGNSLRIRHSRIVATLVLLNVDKVDIKDANCWEPPFPNYPALLVSGDVDLHLDHKELDEDHVEKNLNPANTPYPYPYGASNSNETDTYPSHIRGLVYVSGQLQLYGDTAIHGVLVCAGNCSCFDPSGASSDIHLTFDPSFSNNPPPGFEASVSVNLEGGSWIQIVD